MNKFVVFDGSVGQFGYMIVAVNRLYSSLPLPATLGGYGVCKARICLWSGLESMLCE